MNRLQPSTQKKMMLKISDFIFIPTWLNIIPQMLFIIHNGRKKNCCFEGLMHHG